MTESTEVHAQGRIGAHLIDMEAVRTLANPEQRAALHIEMMAASQHIQSALRIIDTLTPEPQRTEGRKRVDDDRAFYMLAALQFNRPDAKP